MADPKSYIGGIIQISASAPATVDASGYGSLTYTTIGKVVSVGQVGDTHGDISSDTLGGRVYHANGAVDGGEVPFSVLYDPAGDAGLTIVVAGNGTNNPHSIKITDPDSKITYFHGVLANFKDNERNSTTFKGFSFVLRVNAPTIRPGI